MIGIYGGTFDPVHFGHLRTALDVKQTLDIDDMRLLPCRVPPHRDAPGASAAQRLALLELALARQDDLCLDTRELRRDGPSYMVDTLRSLRDEYASEPLCLVLGEDAFAGLDHWRQWRQLPELAHLVVMSRPGHAPEFSGPVGELVASRRVEDTAELRRRAAGALLFCPVTALAISATAIRAMIGRGQSPRYLLPDAVLESIRQQGLYG